MGLYWDETTCNITNQAGLTLRVADVPNPVHGEYGIFPSNVAANSTASPAFMVRSRDASEIGPEGSLLYDLDDGTILNISWDQRFAVLQKSTFTAALEGGRSGSYGLSLNCSWQTWNRLGARWTVNLTVSPNPGESFVVCQHTR